MALIRFRRLNRQEEIIGDVRVQRWEVALSEAHLWAKLDGEMAEIDMPAQPWLVRVWRRMCPKIVGSA